MKNSILYLCLILISLNGHTQVFKEDHLLSQDLDSLNLKYYETINKNPRIGLTYAEKAFELSKTTSSPIQFKTITNYATALYINEQFDIAYNIIQQAETLANNPEEKALYLTIKGLIANDLNKTTDAETAFKEALELYTSLNDKNNQFAVLNNLGLLYNNNGEYKKSLKAYLQCYDIINDINDEIDSYKYFLNLGAVSYNLNDYQNAQNSFLKALNEAREKNDSLRIYKANEKLAQTYMAIDSTAQALSFYKNTLPFYQRSGLKKDATNVLIQLGSINYSLGHKEKGWEYFKEAEILALQNGYVQNKALVFLKIAVYYKDKGILEDAENYLHKVIKMEGLIANLEILKLTYTELYAIARQRKDQASSLSYLEKASYYQDLIKEKHLISESDQIEARLSLKKKELELENLKINYELNELQISNQKQKIQGLVIFAILIGVLLWLSVAMYFQKRKSQKKLFIQNSKIQLQNKKLIDINTEIKSQRQELASLNLLKDELLSILAHDVKSPITNLSHLLFILRNSLDHLKKDELEKNLANIEVNSANLLNLLNNILNWIISQSKGIKVKITGFSLTELIKQNIKIVESSIVSKDLTIEFHDHTDHIIHSDKNIIDLTIRNLLSNAVKFTPKNGIIKIEAVKVNDEMYHIKIIDTGIGFDERIHSMLKGNIEKVPVTSGTSKEKGYGIGLSLCKKMLLKINSKIVYEKNSPKGSVFIVHINTKTIENE